MVVAIVAYDETMDVVAVALNIHNGLYHPTHIIKGNGIIHHILTRISCVIFYCGYNLGPIRYVRTRQLETQTSKLVYLSKSQILRLM